MLWLLLAFAASGHSGPDAHAEVGCDDLPGILRHAQALTSDGRLDEAKAAIGRAVACGAEPADVDLAIGTLQLTAGRPADALPALHRAVDRRPGPPTWVARARALEELGRHADAAADRLAAIEATEAPAPDLWLAAARSLAAAGRSAEALAVVDRGLASCGPVAGLVRAGVELAEAVDPDDALRRLEGLRPSPVWLQLRGEVLARAGRVPEARAAVEEALALARSARPSRRTEAQIATLQTTLQHLEAR